EGGSIIARDALPDLVDRVICRIVAGVDVGGDIDDVGIVWIERGAAEVVLLPPIALVAVEGPAALDEARRLPLRAVEARVGHMVARGAVVLVCALVLTSLPQDADGPILVARDIKIPQPS